MDTQEVVKITGLSKDTIRYYEKEGLISKPPREMNGYRIYNDTVVNQLEMISKAKSLGFTLKEIKELSHLLYSDRLTKDKMKSELEEKKRDILEKISELQKIENEINKALSGLCSQKDQLR